MSQVLGSCSGAEAETWEPPQNWAFHLVRDGQFMGGGFQDKTPPHVGGNSAFNLFTLFR